MSRENVKALKRSFDHWEQGQLDQALKILDTDVVWEEAPSLGPDAAVYRGIDEAKGALESWLGMWDDYTAEVHEYVDAGDQTVVLSRERGRGRTGVRAEREVGSVYTFRGGRVVRVRLCGSWQEALEAVGLRE